MAARTHARTHARTRKAHAKKEAKEEEEGDLDPATTHLPDFLKAGDVLQKERREGFLQRGSAR